MKRLLVFALVASVANASAAFAGESILTAGTRHVQQLAVAESSSGNSTTASATAVTPAGTTVGAGQKTTPAFQAQGTGGNLSKSGMGKGMKTMLYIGLAVGFAASVWAIDHHVLDVTPSSLGTRQD